MVKWPPTGESKGHFESPGKSWLRKTHIFLKKPFLVTKVPLKNSWCTLQLKSRVLVKSNKQMRNQKAVLNPGSMKSWLVQFPENLQNFLFNRIPLEGVKILQNHPKQKKYWLCFFTGTKKIEIRIDGEIVMDIIWLFIDIIDRMWWMDKTSIHFSFPQKKPPQGLEQGSFPWKKRNRVRLQVEVCGWSLPFLDIFTKNFST